MIEQEDLKNLMIFLQRVELKGAEVPAFNKAVLALQKATEPEAPINPEDTEE